MLHVPVSSTAFLVSFLVVDFRLFNQLQLHSWDRRIFLGSDKHALCLLTVVDLCWF